jgi:hypothetical protein
MKTIQTGISDGYISLIEIFCKANDIVAVIDTAKTDKFNHIEIPKITISYDENSESANTLAFLALKHCSVDNMLHDYLMRCGVDGYMISCGKAPTKSATDEEYEEYRKSRRRKTGWTM